MLADNPFILHTPQYDCLEDLTDEQLGQIFRNLYLLRRGEEIHFADSEAFRAFKFITQQFKYDDEKREKAIAQRKAAADASVNARKRTLTDANINSNININTNSNINIKDKEDKEKKVAHAPAVFVKPTIKEIREYCTERRNNVDAEAFWGFYESKGWKVGGSPMKNWKAAVITWEKRKDNANNKRNSTTFEQRTMVCHDWSNERPTL